MLKKQKEDEKLDALVSAFERSQPVKIKKKKVRRVKSRKKRRKIW